MNTIGERIKHLRANYPVKMTQADLASRLGIKTSAVGQWENGQSKGLKPENLLGVIEIFNCDLRWLVTGNVTYYPNGVNEPDKTGIVVMSKEKHKALELIQR